MIVQAHQGKDPSRYRHGDRASPRRFVPTEDWQVDPSAKRDVDSMPPSQTSGGGLGGPRTRLDLPSL